jgi:hypothetical protein
MIIRDEILTYQTIPKGALVVNCVLIDCEFEEDVIIQQSKIVSEGKVQKAEPEEDCNCKEVDAEEIFSDLEEEPENEEDF